MKNLVIDTGKVNLTINDDPDRVISFNPSDVVFAEKFYQLIRDFEAKEGEYQRRGAEIEANTKVSENGIPENIGDGIALLREICEWVREHIDNIFGKGTSQVVFGDAMSLDMFSQFFTGITPYVEAARSEKTAKYRKDKSIGK